MPRSLNEEVYATPLLLQFADFISLPHDYQVFLDDAMLWI